MIKAAGASLLLPLLLAACSDFPYLHAREYVPVVDGGGSVNSNLEEIHAASTMTTQQQERFLADMENDFRKKPDVDNRLRLALLLIAGNKPVRDHARARLLLEEIEAPASISTSQQGLVQLLSQFLDEEKAMLGEMDSCTEQIMQQERRINELEQQQKELTSIEQNIQHRDKPVEVEK